MTREEKIAERVTRNLRTWILVGRILLASLLLVVSAQSQSFSLQTARTTDKVAQSRFFSVDSNKFIETYDPSSFSAPVAVIHDSLFVIAAVQSTVSSAKRSSDAVAKDFSLSQNYPNPFNPSTTIRYAVGMKAKVTVTLFDAVGKEVATLVNDTKEAGSHEIQWNGVDSRGASVASGTYFYRLYAVSDDGSARTETRKMSMIK